jgi:hypothetical protein
MLDRPAPPPPLRNGETLRRDIFFLFAILLQTAIIGWLVMEVGQMKGNRFTSGDGLAVWKAISEKADSDDVPPQWLQDAVERIESRLRALEEQH